MKRIGIISFLCFLSIGFFTLSSCSTDSSDAKSKFNVRLTDAPGDYAEVNIDVANVQIHVGAGDGASGWRSLTLVNPGVYNLLDFVNGNDTLLASDELPAGKVSQIRLVLGDNNSLKLMDGTLISNLVVPSGQESGLKLNIDADIAEGVAYNLTLDFDAAKSIVSKGNGTYSLKPTIRTVLTATSGAIKGTVTPTEAHPNIQAIMGNDTITTYPDAEGKFLFRGLSAGTYKVLFVPAAGYQELVKEGVVVTIGNTTDLQTITITGNQ